MLTALVSCERKPLYLYGDCLLNVNITANVSIETFWRTSWRDSLVYNWDETKYGPIGYTAPEDVDIVIFNDNQLVKRQTMKVGRRQPIDVELDKEYDILIHNKTFETEFNHVGGRYYVSTPGVESKAALDNEYETVFQPGEIFSAYKTNIFLSSDVSQYDEVYDNGKLVYVYNIDATITPVSYIYIIQFIIVNDDHSAVIEAKDITNFTINGVCDVKDLFSCTPKYNGKKQISHFDVHEGQQVVDSLVFAARVTVLDLVPDSEDGSWSTRENYLYYSGIDIMTQTLGSVSGIVDITKQMNENPKGGVLTVRILNSEIKKAAGTDENGFGIDLKDWSEHHIDITF